MKTYRMNALMAGVLYILGTVGGILSGVVGGELVASTITGNALTGADILSRAAAGSSQLTLSAFLILVMGFSLSAMTLFLYPLFRKDSEPLAMGLVVFRGALEGIGYVLVALNILLLIALGQQYVATGADSAALQSVGYVIYQYGDISGPVGTFAFLIGATCLYVSFYRTRLIPRWLSVWGLIGVVPYLAYALLHFFHIDNGVGLYLQMPLAIQEMVMGGWLIIAGFKQGAVKKLEEAH
jgi:hypothetical protein